MFKLIIAYIRGWIAGKRGTSLWFCPYYLDIDTGYRSLQADVWIEAWSIASRGRFAEEHRRWQEAKGQLLDEPF